MLYVVFAVGLAVLIGFHELVVRVSTRTIRRPWAVLLGPVAGYAVLAGFAFALYAGYGMDTGHRVIVVIDVLPGYDAAGKLEAGDRIIELDRVAVEPHEITSRVEAAGGKPVALTIERAGERRDITVQPKQSKAGDGRTVWLLGITRGSSEIRVHDTGAALEAAVEQPIRGVRAVAVQTYELIAGKEEPEMGGPMRIVEELTSAVPTRPAIQGALEWLLVWGVYVWFALSIFDLIRLVRLSRQPDARSNVR